MKYSIKTRDNYWIGFDGEHVTKNKKERAIFDSKSLARWYISNTNLFGSLKIVKNKIG
jgi:hypothetical protein